MFITWLQLISAVLLVLILCSVFSYHLNQMISVSLSLSPPPHPHPFPHSYFVFYLYSYFVFYFHFHNTYCCFFFSPDRTASGSYFTATDKTVPGNCGHSGIAGLDSGLGMAQNDGQEQHSGPVANMDQSGSHSQAAALFCYGLTPMQHSYMQWK